MNPETGLEGLKEFQQRTVEYAFRRMYLDEDYTRRFLVADETGLGKTLVARGIIAKTVEHLIEKGIERVDVIYICSNGNIARQNLQKLVLPGQEPFSDADRITLLPETLSGLEKNRVNFVSFTPQTSFKMGSKMGIVNERVLLYWLLDGVWDCEGRGTAPCNIFQGTVQGFHWFREQIKARGKRDIEPSIFKAFAKAVRKKVADDHIAGESTLEDRFDELCYRFKRFRRNIPREDRELQQGFIGKLRGLLAKSCLQALEPDLIILDEFQRFRDLLSSDDPNDEAALLANELFNYSDEQAEARVLLLSATPYKMYTLHHEVERGDDHYADFLNTYKFLASASEEKTGRLNNQINAYGEAMLDFKDGADETKSRLKSLKEGIEDKLKSVMARTERLPASRDSDGMFEEVQANEPVLGAKDVRTYYDLQKLGKQLQHPHVIEYWKSAPFLFNFMRRYKLKVKFNEEFDDSAIAGLIRFRDDLFLSQEAIEDYRPIDSGNAKIRSLVEDIRESGAGEILWLPPSCPYYSLPKAFEKVSRAGFTKRLVFSAWQIVPKSIAMLLSYEVERMVFQKDEERPRNTPKARDKRSSTLLRFTRRKDSVTGERRPSGMPLLTLCYPGITLAEVGDPLLYQGDSGSLPSYSEIKDRVSRELAPLLEELTADAPVNGEVDESWYWAAAILLDKERFAEISKEWWEGGEEDDEGNKCELAVWWACSSLYGEEPDEAKDFGGSEVWEEHVAHAKSLVDGDLPLGRPPEDLLQVITMMALGGPGVTALRSLGRLVGPDSMKSLWTRGCAGEISMSFIYMFNRPEAMAMLGRKTKSKHGPYWRRVLAYCAEGCLSSVLDEYAHLVTENSGKAGEEDFDRTIASDFHEKIQKALGLHITSLRYDEIHIEDDQVISEKSMRSHFARRFAADQRDKNITHSGQVKDAFMSPFWPFVLATTSVGQEGLDFHWYCHSVVHWNLPSNPVDLEQREGRVNRYKGHAIRKNIAKKYGSMLQGGIEGDPWEAMFAAAEEDALSKDRGLVPYWIFEDEGIENPAKIERRVPNLPLSKDRKKLEALKRSLVLYRMVFGQPRQEDLLEYLQKEIGIDDLEKSKDLFRMNLEPPSPQPENEPQSGAGGSGNGLDGAGA